MAPCRDRNPTPIRFEERRIQGLFGLKTTLLLVLKQSRAGARFWGRAGRFQTLKQRRLFYAGRSQVYDPSSRYAQYIDLRYTIHILNMLSI